MEKIGTIHNNSIVFDKLNVPEGNKIRVIVEEEKINPKVLALVGLIERDEETDDLKEYISKNKRLDYENIR